MNAGDVRISCDDCRAVMAQTNPLKVPDGVIAVVVLHVKDCPACQEFLAARRVRSGKRLTKAEEKAVGARVEAMEAKYGGAEK